MEEDGPPPPPPPHGANPRPTGGLPDGNYDIFVIPPHSAGGGFLYLPSLQPQRNSFLAGIAVALAAVGIYVVVMPVLQGWLASVMAGNAFGVLILVALVGLGAWAIGKTSAEMGSGPSAGGSGASGTRQQHRQSAGPQPNGYAPPPRSSNHPPPPPPKPGSAPPPQSEPEPPPPPPPPEPEPKPQPKPAQSGWEKAREETRRREEERKRAEELQKKRDAMQKAREEAEAAARKAREDAERAAKAQMEKEKWEQARAREKEQREREARERLAREKLAKDKETREKDAREREAREKADKDKAEREKAARERLEKIKAEREERQRSASASPTKPPTPSAARSFTGTESQYSFRPYDTQSSPTKSRTAYKSSASSISGLSESSYAPSMSTARTTPPPSQRGPYSTNDPEKIQIRAVYLFSDSFPGKPTAQLIANEGSVTDGLVLHIKTEGLFIDDDVRKVPQREWDVKAWTLKQVEDGAFKGAAGGKGLHVFRATTRDAENKKYTFVLEQSEGYKVALGLERLKKGSQVRSLNKSNMKEGAVKTVLDSVGWL